MAAASSDTAPTASHGAEALGVPADAVIPDQKRMKQALQAYVDLTNAGDAAGLAALFAPDARIEDPIGSPLKTREEFSVHLANGAAYGARIIPVAPIRGSFGPEAALMFDVEYTPPGGKRTRVRSLDVCTFNDEGLITAMRAYWGPDDVEEIGD